MSTGSAVRRAQLSKNDQVLPEDLSDGPHVAERIYDRPVLHGFRLLSPDAPFDVLKAVRPARPFPSRRYQAFAGHVYGPPWRWARLPGQIRRTTSLSLHRDSRCVHVLGYFAEVHAVMMQRKPIGTDPWQSNPRTPGPLGINDAASPFGLLPGPTPGPVGVNDGHTGRVLNMGRGLLSPNEPGSKKEEEGASPSGRCAPVEIEINNTPGTVDDLVSVKCLLPAGAATTPCRIRTKSKKSGGFTVVLTNPDRRLRFGDDKETLRIDFSTDGVWVNFEISGAKGSEKLNDAIIEAHCESETGDLVGKKPVTVFWFDQTAMEVNAGGKYAPDPLDLAYTVMPGFAVNLKASARIRPSGVNCDAPQIKDLRVGIIQNSFPPDGSRSRTRRVVYGPPTIDWDITAPDGARVKVPAQWERNFASSTASNDSTPAASPLYQLPGGGVLKPPIGCKGGGSTESRDTPGTELRAAIKVRVSDGSGSGDAPAREPVSDDGGKKLEIAPVINGRGKTMGIATYPFQQVSHKEKFMNWAVIYNVKTKEFCCLRQRTWNLDLDSASTDSSHTQAVPDSADAEPTTAPITTGKFSNEFNQDPANWSNGPVAGPTVEVVKPATPTP